MNESGGTHYDDRMSDADNLLWIIEQNPLLRSTITAVLFLSEMPDRGLLHRRVDRATRRIPRLRQRVIGNPLSIAPPRWEIDPHFNLAFHLRWADLGGSGTERQVLDLVQPIAMQGFDRARPLWEFTLVDGLVDGSAALVVKVHHAVTDGVGAIRILLEILSLSDAERADDESMPPEPVGEVLTPSERARHAMDYELRRSVRAAGEIGEGLRRLNRDPVGTACRVANALGSLGRIGQPSPRPLSPLMTDRSLSVSLDAMAVPITGLKAAASAADVKLNAAYVTAICRAMRRLHRDYHTPVSHLRMGMPINRRAGAETERAGNEFTPIRLRVPIDIGDPVEHMQVIDRLVRRERAEPGLGLVEPAAGLLRRLPGSLTTQIFTAALRGIDFMSSNVPGVAFPVYLEGAQVRAIVPFGPLSGSGVNLTLLSYLDQAHIGINADPAAVPDTELLRAALAESFEELFSLA